MSDSSPPLPLNPRVRGLPQSATVAINERSDELRAQGKEVFKLGLGQSPFPVPRSVGVALRRHAFEKDYLPTRGLFALRESVARHHERVFGIACSPDDVLVGPGSKELMFILQLAYDGEVLIPTPAWVSYAPQASIIGRPAHFLQTRQENEWRLTPEELEAACSAAPDQPRILVLNYPSNPTGGTYAESELEALARVARKYKVVVLSDEIYAKIQHDGKHRSIVPLYPEGTIFSGGLSKWCGAGGWRLGVFVVPPQMHWLLEAMAAVASETFTSTSAPIQHAAVTAFDGSPEIDTYLAHSRWILRALGTGLARRLRAAGVDVPEPKGGFYLFPDFSPLRERLAARGIADSPALCARILSETGVAFLPGAEFGRDPSELTARIAYVDFDGSAALDAVAALDEENSEGGSKAIDDAFVVKYCARTVEAVERIVAWLVQESSD